MDKINNYFVPAKLSKADLKTTDFVPAVINPSTDIGAGFKHEGFGNRLKVLRLARGKKQAEVADALGISRQTMSNYEGGKHAPDLDLVVQFAQFYECTVDYLLGVEIPRTTESQSEDVAKLTELLLSSISPRLDKEWAKVFFDIANCVTKCKGNNNAFASKSLAICKCLIELMWICLRAEEDLNDNTDAPDCLRSLNDKRHKIFQKLRASIEVLNDVSYLQINEQTGQESD